MNREGGLPPAAGPGTRDQESRWKQYLEDERIALFLQNEEFMKELQRNRDFLLALERGGAPGGALCPFSVAEEVADAGWSLGAQARQGAGGQGLRHGPHPMTPGGAPEPCQTGTSITSYPFSHSHIQRKRGVPSYTLFFPPHICSVPGTGLGMMCLELRER